MFAVDLSFQLIAFRTNNLFYVFTKLLWESADQMAERSVKRYSLGLN